MAMNQTRAALMALLRGPRGAQQMELFKQQMRRMGGGGGGAPTYRALDGKPPPPQFQTDEFVTYAGLTLPKPKKDLDYWYARAIGSLFWFSIFYHFNLNWDEHYWGDLMYMERDVQRNGWDEDHGHGHGHGHH